MQERFESFTTLTSKISRSIRRLKSEEMSAFGLRGPHVTCLHYLDRFGPMTAAELCERCAEDKAAISRSVEFLEKSGLLCCEDSEKKRYKSVLSLTEKGREICTAISKKIDAAVDAAGEGLSEEDRRAMYRALTLISRNLEQLHLEQQSENFISKEGDRR